MAAAVFFIRAVNSSTIFGANTSPRWFSSKGSSRAGEGASNLADTRFGASSFTSEREAEAG